MSTPEYYPDREDPESYNDDAMRSPISPLVHSRSPLGAGKLLTVQQVHALSLDTIFDPEAVNSDSNATAEVQTRSLVKTLT